MLVVVVDTSTPAVTAGLVRLTGDVSQVEVVGERRTINARAHGELLAPAIAELLAEAGARPRDLTAVVAGLGPGPFTGLRVGLVTAGTISQALAIPAYGVCSLDGIGMLADGVILVATDARRKEVYWAGYDSGMRVTEPAVNRPADVPAVLAERGFVPTAAAGEGAVLHADVLELPVLAEPRYPVVVALARLAVDRIEAAAPSEALVPLYLRRPDAVEPAQRKLVNS